MNTLNINFFNETIDATAKNEFMEAVAHEGYNMEIALVSESISKLEKKIANNDGNYEESEVEAFKVQLEKAIATRTALEEKEEATKEVYEKVVTAMTVKDKNGYGNHVDVVRTVLRVLATWNNSKLVKYAIIPCFTSPKLYDALEAIHVNSTANENGELSFTKEVKEAYKNASKELESIIKNTFSLPFDTAYTAKTRVKITAEDKKMLHDCYIKGFSNKFSVNEKKGTVSFSERQINTLVKVKKGRDGVIKYDYSGLASVIANIVIKHYFVEE